MLRLKQIDAFIFDEVTGQLIGNKDFFDVIDHVAACNDSLERQNIEQRLRERQTVIAELRHYTEVIDLGDSQFKFKHKELPSQDFIVTLNQDATGQDRWVSKRFGMNYVKSIMDQFGPDVQAAQPLFVLRTILWQEMLLTGLRPQEEVDRLVEQQIQVREDDISQLYEIQGRVGKGAFAEVLKCKRKEDGKLFALKSIFRNDKQSRHILYECSLGKLVQSPFVLRCEDVFQHREKLLILQEYMEDGDLGNIPKMKFSEEFCKYTLYCVATGLHTLHARHVLHRDIKAENILIRSSTGEIKLADLGLSVILTSQEAQRSSAKGAVAFMSPEIVQGKLYGKEIDIWAFGCTAYELAMHKLPFQGLGIGEVGIFEAVQDQSRPAPQLSNEWSDDYRDLVKRCLDKNSDTRIKIEEVVDHPFLQGANTLKQAWIDHYKLIIQNDLNSNPFDRL